METHGVSLKNEDEVMIAAVTGENMINIMNQGQAAGNGAVVDVDGFDALLNMMMSLEPQAVAPAASDEAPAEMLDFVLPEPDEGAIDQDRTDDATNPAYPSAPVARLIQALAHWMRPQAEPTESTPTIGIAAKNTETKTESQTTGKTAPVAQAATRDASKPLPAPVVAAIAKLANLEQVVFETGEQNAAPADAAPKQTAAVVDAKVIEAAADPNTISVAVQPNIIAKNGPNKIEPAAAQASEGSEEKDSAPHAEPILVQMVSNSKPAADGNSIHAESDTQNPAPKQNEDKTAQPDPVWNILAMSAPVPETPKQPVAASTTTATPETVSAKSATTPIAATKQTLSAPSNQSATSTISPIANNPTATVAAQKPAAAAEPITWNLSELAHRFDAPLKQVLTEQPATVKPTVEPTVEPKIDTISGSIKTATQVGAVAKLATVTESKPASTSDDTITVATSQSRILTWQAQPGKDESGKPGMQAMTEQLRQASEWLAAKAEGTIRVGDKGTEATLRLHPADLGGIRVSLNVGRDLNVQARFIAERPETAQALQQNLSQLQDAFTRQGLTLDKVQVTVAPSASQNSGNTQNQQGFSNMRRESQTASQQERRQSGERGNREKQQQG